MVWSRGIWLCVFAMFLLPSIGAAQTNRYMVFFKDKAGSSYSVNQPRLFLSDAALARRAQQDISVVDADLPVNQSYVDGVRTAGASVFFSTRWLNGVLVQCDAALVNTLSKLPYVDHLEYVAPNAQLTKNGRTKSVLKTKSSKANDATQVQLQMLGIDAMQSSGYRGEGRTIAIFDSGFLGVNQTLPFHHLYLGNPGLVESTYDFVYNTDDVYRYDEHGTEVFSVIAAFQEGVFTGGAYNAVFHLYVTEDVGSEYRIEEYNWLFAAERADSAGVDMIHSSLGYYDFDDASMNYPKTAMDGKTTVITRAAQFAADRGIVVVCSAGNEGNVAWQMITAPADAVDVLSVANVNSSGQRVGSSSIGPSSDGRIKPDVAALGAGTSVIRPNGLVGTASGTSLSAPLVTSLVAGVWERYPFLTAREVIDAVRKSASLSQNPNNQIGYGIPNFKAVVNYLEVSGQENVFDIFPNPVSSGNQDTLTIRPRDPEEIASCRIEVLTSSGRQLYDSQIGFSWLNRSHQTSLRELAPGIYFLRITWGEGRRGIYRIVRQ